MKYSQLLGTTLREAQHGADLASHDLLLRAGYIRQLAAGIFSYLHLGQRSLKKVEGILREEMDRIGGVEISMPVVHPAELWKKTGRYDDIDDSLVRFKDRTDRPAVLAMTHEEVVADLARTEVSSYKQLPLLVYQLQTKFRDEARSRGGLIRVREFVMKDSYSLDTSWEGLEKQYQNHYDAYFRMFKRAGLPVIAIESDVGMMGGKVAHEYMYVTEIGEDTIFISDNTGYMANKEVATFKKEFVEAEPQELEKVHTPAAKTIEELQEFMQLPASAFGKAVFFTIEKEEKPHVIVAVVRGDMEVHQIKIQKMIGATEMRPSTEPEIKAIGLEPGFASPIGANREMCTIIVDDLIAKTNNLVVGANEVDYHLKNACYGRDYEADQVGDIVAAFDGALAPDAKGPEDKLRAVRGVEVGNIFQLGIKYTKALDATFMDTGGRPQPIIMGSYGIGVGRLLACLIEEYNDENGIKLPISVAPYQVHLVSLMENEEISGHSDALYESLRKEGVEVLYDNRGHKVATAGVKFSDADLVGCPIRLTVSKRSIKNGGVEMKIRQTGDSEILAIDDVLGKVVAEVARQFAELEA